MKKVFYVCDSFNTMKIVEQIKRAVPDSIVYSDATIVSQGPDFLSTALNKIIKDRTEKSQKKNEATERVDLFLLSAKLICDGSLSPKELKEKYGNKDSKIIAISVSSSFLKEVSSLVDLTADKGIFFNVESIRKFFNDLK